MNTISYFQSIPNSDFSQQSEELIEVYKQSWSKHGWNPIVLNEEYAQRNELLHKLDLDNPDANFYKTINPSSWKYHRSCYCRLLAYCQYVRENGATLYSDYDVMNYGFTLSILNFAKENSYFCGERAVVYLGEKVQSKWKVLCCSFPRKNLKMMQVLLMCMSWNDTPIFLLQLKLI